MLPEQYNERGNSECEEKKWKQEARIQSVGAAERQRRPVVLSPGEKRRKEELSLLHRKLITKKKKINKEMSSKPKKDQIKHNH